MRKKDFWFRVGSKGFSKMHVYTDVGKESSKLVDKQEEWKHKPILTGREYISRGRNNSYDRPWQEELTKGVEYSGEEVVKYERALMRHRAAQERKRRVAQLTEIEPIFLDKNKKAFIFQRSAPFTPQLAVEKINSESEISCWSLKKFLGVRGFYISEYWT